MSYTAEMKIVEIINFGVAHFSVLLYKLLLLLNRTKILLVTHGKELCITCH